VLRAFATLLLVGAIRAYQLLLSPWIGNRCRHQPTCSAYALEAICRFGPLHGAWLGAKRIARCHPWGTWGYDPVADPDAAPRRDPNRTSAP
jgi:putative membrane protein insertion efficiency factor